MRDGDGLAAVPFCQHLRTACHVSHRCGVPAVHLLDHKERVNFEKLGKEVGTKGNASLGKDDAKLAKERFKVLADFVKEQREICLRDRYKLPIPQAPPAAAAAFESLTGVPTGPKRKKTSTDAGEGSSEPTRKSRRNQGLPVEERGGESGVDVRRT